MDNEYVSSYVRLKWLNCPASGMTRTNSLSYVYPVDKWTMELSEKPTGAIVDLEQTTGDDGFSAMFTASIPGIYKLIIAPHFGDILLVGSAQGIDPANNCFQQKPTGSEIEVTITVPGGEYHFVPIFDNDLPQSMDMVSICTLIDPKSPTLISKPIDMMLTNGCGAPIIAFAEQQLAGCPPVIIEKWTAQTPCGELKTYSRAISTFMPVDGDCGTITGTEEKLIELPSKWSDWLTRLNAASKFIFDKDFSELLGCSLDLKIKKLLSRQTTATVVKCCGDKLVANKITITDDLFTFPGVGCSKTFSAGSKAFKSIPIIGPAYEKLVDFIEKIKTGLIAAGHGEVAVPIIDQMNQALDNNAATAEFRGKIYHNMQTIRRDYPCDASCPFQEYSVGRYEAEIVGYAQISVYVPMLPAYIIERSQDSLALQLAVSGYSAIAQWINHSVLGFHLTSYERKLFYRVDNTIYVDSEELYFYKHGYRNKRYPGLKTGFPGLEPSMERLRTFSQERHEFKNLCN